MMRKMAIEPTMMARMTKSITRLVLVVASAGLSGWSTGEG